MDTTAVPLATTRANPAVYDVLTTGTATVEAPAAMYTGLVSLAKFTTMTPMAPPVMALATFCTNGHDPRITTAIDLAGNP